MTKSRQKVGKSVTNILLNPHFSFSYAGRFFCEEAWIHPRRTEETYEIIYVTDGDVYMNDGGVERHAAPGQLMLLCPGVEHSGSRQSTGVSFYWVHFWLTEGVLPFDQRFFPRFDHAYLFRELLHYVHLPVRPDYLVNALLAEILSQMCFEACSRVCPANPLAGEIGEWIRANASATLTVRHTAQHFRLSPDHVSRLVRQQYGIGAKALIDRFVLLQARELLLNTGLYVKEIAHRLGFASDNAFVGFFKYHEGVFPSEYRSRYTHIHINNH